MTLRDPSHHHPIADHRPVVGVALVILVIVVTLIAAVAPSLLPFSPRADEETRKVAALPIFVASYLALAIGKIPGLSIDRAGVALVGAGLMVASGVLSLEDAYRAIDLDTITLLLGMMIVVASLRLVSSVSSRARRRMSWRLQRNRTYCVR
jgi:di/tricarboxylate transporter